MKLFWESWTGGRRRVLRTTETMSLATSPKGGQAKTHVAKVERIVDWDGGEPRRGTPEERFLWGAGEPVVVKAETLCGLDLLDKGASVDPVDGNVCKRCERRAESWEMDEAFMPRKRAMGVREEVAR